MRIAITGEKGFLGIQLTNYFRHILKYEVIELGRDYFNTLSKQDNIDWLILGAFIHRHPEQEKVLTLNRELTQRTLNCLEESNFQGNITFLSSIQERNGSLYGQAKLEAKKVFNDYCISINKKFISLRLPNIFGEYAVPNKTSFIASFCYNLHNEITINYNENKVSLCYVNDVVALIGEFNQLEIPTVETSVDQVYFILKRFNDTKLKSSLPELKTKFELDLYTTYLQYTNYKL